MKRVICGALAARDCAGNLREALMRRAAFEWGASGVPFSRRAPLQAGVSEQPPCHLRPAPQKPLLLWASALERWCAPATFTSLGKFARPAPVCLDKARCAPLFLARRARGMRDKRRVAATPAANWMNHETPEECNVYQRDRCIERSG
ncbi:hypothetical protein SAMN05216466_108148 [Paraburkholderia phenazinium]|uniref:Uncharacterized protein n=1 Tax=Paraburkholderia phenazinium TaxID=60549 RepID=A0A1G8AYU4_9BURK|nr:hypothetical protein SAMN05216466_108148 [Paraburkholderia phenazinium]